MKQEAGLCKIIPDCNGMIANWVCAGLGENTDWIGANVTIGIVRAGKLIAGVIYNDCRPGVDVWMTIYSASKYWCSRRILKHIFAVAFDVMDCRRVSAFVSVDNQASKSMLERLGFKREGLLRQYRDNGEDCFLFGMLKSECKWR